MIHMIHISPMKPALCAAISLLILGSLRSPAEATCGAMAPIDRTPLAQRKPLEGLVNDAAKVIMVRDGDSTTITMAANFKGKASEFAVLVPVPTVIQESQIQIVAKEVFERLEKATGPVLTESWDPDPCGGDVMGGRGGGSGVGLMASGSSSAGPPRAADYGVKVEAAFAVGEYTMAVLSAETPRGLLDWLNRFHYRLPASAEPVLGSYLKQGMRFFVARVALEKQAELGFEYLRPIQVQYETRKFMLPIRLGRINAAGPQEVLFFGLSPRGRIEPVNYRLRALPGDAALPPLVARDFRGFYDAMFAHQAKQAQHRSIFLEHAAPLAPRDLAELGIPESRAGAEWFVTRLRMRYTPASFPSDITLRDTPNRQGFALAYQVRHPAGSLLGCLQGQAYAAELQQRTELEIATLSRLTGWSRKKIDAAAAAAWARPPESPGRPRVMVDRLELEGGGLEPNKLMKLLRGRGSAFASCVARSGAPVPIAGTFRVEVSPDGRLGAARLEQGHGTDVTLVAPCVANTFQRIRVQPAEEAWAFQVRIQWFEPEGR